MFACFQFRFLCICDLISFVIDVVCIMGYYYLLHICYIIQLDDSTRSGNCTGNLSRSCGKYMFILVNLVCLKGIHKVKITGEEVWCSCAKAFLKLIMDKRWLVDG